MSVRFKVSRDYDSEYLLMASAPMTDSDWPIWFAIKLIDMAEHVSDRELKELDWRYNVEIHAISPQAVSVEKMASAMESCGVDNLNALGEEYRAEVLLDYGISACIWQKNGTNKTELLRLARKEMMPINMLFGFYMDKQLNRIGNTGWDFIKGEIGFNAIA